MKKIDKPKIMYVHNVSVVGGAERVTQMLATQLLERGEFEVLVALPDEGELSAQLRKQGVETVSFQFSVPEFKKPIKFMIDFFRWCSLIKRQGVSCIHTGDLWSYRSVAFACKALGLPVVSHMHYRYDDPLVVWLLKGCPKPSAYVYCSDYLKRELNLLQQGTNTKSKHVVIHNGVDMSKYQFHQKSRLVSRIGIIANLGAVKGHEYFIKMAKLLVDDGFEGVFDIVGGDTLTQNRRQELEQLVTTLGIQGKVIFHGQVENVYDYLLDLDILVLSSIEESLPISILESMSSGIPVVATRVGGIPEMIESGKSGLLVEPKSELELFLSVKQLIDDQSLREKIPTCALSSVRAKFDLKTFTDKFESLYRDLL